MKVSIFYSIYCIFTSQVCTTIWLGKLIGTSGECIYCVNLSVFGWSFKTHFGLQWGVKKIKNFQTYFLGTWKGGSKLYIKDKYECHV